MDAKIQKNKVAPPHKASCCYCLKDIVWKQGDYTEEHFPPAWLVKKTGKNDRGGTLVDLDGKRSKRQLRKQHLPCCKKCNGTMSELEQRTQRAVDRLEMHDVMKCDDIHALFDWFDKHRGMRLQKVAMYDRKLRGIMPLQSVLEYIGHSDALLGIARCGIQGPTKLMEVGTDVYDLIVPTTTSLRLNRLAIVSCSIPFLGDYLFKSWRRGRELFYKDTAAAGLRLTKLKEAHPLRNVESAVWFYRPRKRHICKDILEGDPIRPVVFESWNGNFVEVGERGAWAMPMLYCGNDLTLFRWMYETHAVLRDWSADVLDDLGHGDMITPNIWQETRKQLVECKRQILNASDEVFRELMRNNIVEIVG
jgi:hypothetical protein